MRCTRTAGVQVKVFCCRSVARGLVTSGFLIFLLVAFWGREGDGDNIPPTLLLPQTYVQGGRDLLHHSPATLVKQAQSLLLKSSPREGRTKGPLNVTGGNRQGALDFMGGIRQGAMEITGGNRQGFLEVSKVLKDPKTTQDPSRDPRTTQDPAMDAKQDNPSAGTKDPHGSSKDPGIKLDSPLSGIAKEESERREKNRAAEKDLMNHEVQEPGNTKNTTKDKDLNLLIGGSKKLSVSTINKKLKELKARIKSDLLLVETEQNNADFRHVMQYNVNFVPHLTKDLYIPGYKITNPDLCDTAGDIELAILVISAPGHVQERQAIRDGWGRHRNRSDVAFAFLLGLPQSEVELEALLNEHSQHGDLVINNVEDVYENLSLKILSGLSWFTEYCPRAAYLLKVDDDMFVQVERLLEALASLDKKSRLILGNISRGWKPVRNPKSKYYITEQQYEADLYPDFATGPSYVISGNSVRSLFDSAMEEKYLHLEDVFITGVLAEKNAVKRKHIDEFKNNVNRIPVRFMGCTLMHTVTIHKVRPEEQKQFEKLSRNPVCGAQTPAKL